MLYQLVKLLTALAALAALLGGISRCVMKSSLTNDPMNFPIKKTPTGDGYPQRSTGYDGQ
jgi:hypothetical protein